MLSEFRVLAISMSATSWTAIGVVVTTIGVVSSWWMHKKANRTTGISNSGRIGDSSIIAVGHNITQHIVNRQHSPDSATEAAGSTLTPETGSSKLEFRQIREALENATPYSRKQIADNYRGLQISWPTEFVSIEEETLSSTGGPQWVVYFAVPARSLTSDYGFVVVNVRIDEYPFLKIAEQGRKCWITGKIDSVRGQIVRLQDDFEIFDRN